MRRILSPLPMFVLAVGLAVLSQWRINRAFNWRYPPLTDLVVTEYYASDLGALFLGSHAIAADMAYVQYLQYYGTHWGEDHESGHHSHSIEDEAAKYPRLFDLGTRLMRLNPFFNSTIIEIAGALAFNAGEIDKALAYLRDAIDRDPSYYRYRLYVAAILYKNNRQDKELIAVLKEAIKYPDCPALLEVVLGNLLKKNGQYVEAALVFKHTIETHPDPFARGDAQDRLDRLLKAHPEVIPQLLKVSGPAQ